MLTEDRVVALKQHGVLKLTRDSAPVVDFVVALCKGSAPTTAIVPQQGAAPKTIDRKDRWGHLPR